MIIKVQRRVRVWLEIQRRYKKMKGLICRYYDRVGNNVALITVVKVMVKHTIKKTHKMKEKGRSEILEQNTTTASEMIEAYQIIAENVNDASNRIEIIEKWLPLREYRIDCMRMALRVEWSDIKPGAKIIKLHYKKLTDEEISTVITLYKRWMQMVLEIMNPRPNNV